MQAYQVRAALMLRNTSYRQWALARQYQPRMVVMSVNRYAGGNKLPRGRLTYRILRDLSQTIGKEIVPGVLGDEA